jgi:hypothetical protein
MSFRCWTYSTLWPRRVMRRGLVRNRTQPRLEILEDRCAPAVFNVNSTADLLTPPAGVVTLRSAIERVNATVGNNIINLTVSGVYKITLAGSLGETDNRAGEFAIIPNSSSPNNSVLLIQNTSGGPVIVDGDHLNRVFDINPGNTNNPSTILQVSMQGFTITNGNAFDSNDRGPGSSGGGIRDQGNASLGLVNMVISGNVAGDDGGGVAMVNPSISTNWQLNLDNTIVTGNHAGSGGGGIETDGSGTVNVTLGQITNNTCSSNGGGISLDIIGTAIGSADLTLTEVLVSGNSAPVGTGGGVHNMGNGNVKFLECTFENNFAGLRGGGFGEENGLGRLVVGNSFFFDNSAVEGGGAIQNSGLDTEIGETTFQANSSGGMGGALEVGGSGRVSIFDCTIHGNAEAAFNLGDGGGGIAILTTGIGSNAATITNCTITGNHAQNDNVDNGGGIDAPAAFTGSLTLINDTINANDAGSGGGVFWAGFGSFIVENAIIAKNVVLFAGPDANNAAGTFTDQGGNVIGIAGISGGNTGFTSATTQTGTPANPLDPKIESLQNNGGPTTGATGASIILQTEALLPTSPAIDRGVAASVTVDERGFPRPDGRGSDHGTQDVGAFESNPLTGNAAFVQTIYLNFLKRLGDVNNPNDAGVWVNALNAGTLTPQAVANAIARSGEALGIVVDGLYQKILHRHSDPLGRAAFVSLVQRGTTVEQVIIDLMTSSEYATLTGGSGAGFIQELYRQLLGREASPGEVNAWSAVLSSQGRAGVARDLVLSAEFRGDVVEQIYGFTSPPPECVASLFADLLHRPSAPPNTEINAWVNSSLDILTIEITIAGSGEFDALASTGILF